MMTRADLARKEKGKGSYVKQCRGEKRGKRQFYWDNCTETGLQREQARHGKTEQPENEPKD